MEGISQTPNIEPVELTESIQIESERVDNLNNEMGQNLDTNEEYRVINQKDLQVKPHPDSDTYYSAKYEEKEDEINDIREIEDELKRNLINSNSNFRNPTFEEPSPGHAGSYGDYHNNIVRDEVMSQPAPLPKINMMQSKSHQNFKIGDPTISTNEFHRQAPLRESTLSTAPKAHNIPIQDQISMFSSQDKRNPSKGVNGMNTSDIVEYNIDPSAYPQAPYADTLERDTSPLVNRQKEYIANTDQIVHNYHSFNPEMSKTEAGETNDETNHPFPYERRNLFSIEDLNTQENKPLREIKAETKSQREYFGSRRRTKVKPSDLPMTTFKAQKHKKLIDERDKYNTDLISADSPMRNLERSQKRHSRRSSQNCKYLTEESNKIKLQNFNFYDL